MNIAQLCDAIEDVSQTYAKRFGISRDSAWHLLKLQEEVGELTQAHLMREGQARDRGLTRAQVDAAFRAEVADVFAHILLLARHHEIDVVEEVERKWFAWRTQEQPDEESAGSVRSHPAGAGHPQ